MEKGDKKNEESCLVGNRTNTFPHYQEFLKRQASDPEQS